MTEKIESRTIRLFASNGRPIRKVTRIIIDGYNIDFTELLTKKQIAKYVASRQEQQRQADFHAEVMSHGN